MKLVRFLFLASLTLLCALGWGCSSGPDSAPPQSDPTGAFDTNYAISAYVTNSGSVQELQFRQSSPAVDVLAQPLRPKGLTFEVDGGTAGAAIATATMSDLARLAISECGARRVADSLLQQQPGLRTGSCVARQAVIGGAYSRATVNPGFDLPTAFVYAAATEPSCTGLETSAQPFLFFFNEPKTAAQVLQYEETLVCAASKLAELADAEKPTSWKFGLYGLASNRATVSPTGKYIDLPTSPPIPWSTDAGAPPVSFRVVQPKDKFLVRDLAMDLLSYVPLLDQLPIRVGTTAVWKTPMEHFVDAANPASIDVTNAAYNIGSTSVTAPFADRAKYYPPLEVDPLNPTTSISWQATSRRHLDMETANLRAAGMLLKDLIEKNVYGAMGGAAQKAAALPPSEKGKAFWLDGADGNSIAEITRVLFGRLGTLGMDTAAGAVVPNTNCTRDKYATANWMIPVNMWSQLAPLGLRTRGDDVALRYSGARMASQMLSASRLGVTSTDMNVVRDSMRDSLANLVGTGAGSDGSTWVQGASGLALQAKIATISDEAMRTAVARQQATVTARSNQPMSANALAALGYTASVAAAGYVASGSIVRQTYDGDLMGPLGLVQVGNECTGTTATTATDWTTALNVALGNPLVDNPTFTGGTVPGRTSGPATAYTPSGPFTPRMRSYQFQDAFAVGQALRDRLVRLRERGRALGATTSEDLAARSGAVFELDGWAGGTRAVFVPEGTANFRVYLLDVNPTDFGLTDASTAPQVAAAFAAVVVPDTGMPATDGDLATVAQCISGTRKYQCPANLAKYKWVPLDAVVDTTTSFADAAKQGQLRKRYELRFGTAAGAGVPEAVSGAPSTPGSKLVNIARLSKTLVRVALGSAKGEILGTVRSQAPITMTDVRDHTGVFSVSPLRRKLIEGVFGFPKADDAPLADTRDYCIPGVPRDVFVPLENELTSDNDSYESSWKHYLTLAKASANKADELGRELIDIGTRIEERKEGASDKLEIDTGGPFDKECLQEQASSFQRDYGKCGDALKAALLTERLDVLLLGDDPYKEGSPYPNAQEALKATLGCGSPTQPGVCTRLLAGGVALAADPTGAAKFPARPDANAVIYAALGIVKGTPAQKATICDGSLLYSNLEGFLSADWAKNENESKIRQALIGAKMRVEDSGDFKVVAGAVTIMDSAAQSGADQLWPGCLRSTTPAPAVACGLDAVPANKFAVLNKALDAAFRTCPGPSGGALGACNGPSANQELAGIRWEAMGAIWTAWSLAGGAPDGALDMPIPAAAFPGAFGTNPDTVCSLPVTNYGPARWMPASGGGYALTGTQLDMNAADAAFVRPATDISASFSAMPANAATMMPYWYRAVYNAGQVGPNTCYGNGIMGYKHIRAQSAQVTSVTGSMSSWLNDGGVSGTTGVGLSMDGWRNLARKQSNSQFAGMIATVKTAFDAGSPGMDYYRDRGAGSHYFMKAVEYSGGAPVFEGPWSFLGSLSRTDQGPILGTPQFSGIPSLWTMGEEPPTEYRWHDFPDEYRAPVQFDCAGGDRDRVGRCAFWPGENKPSWQKPTWRARFFANSLAPLNANAAKRQLAQASALACVITGTPPVYADTEYPPAIGNPTDLRLVEGWLQAKEIVAADVTSRLFLEDIPYQVALLYRANSAGAGALKGQMGVTAIEGMNALRAAGQSWSTASHTVNMARFEVSSLRAGLADLEAKRQVNDANQLLRNIGHMRDIAGALGSVFSANPVPGIFAVANASAAASAASAIEVGQLVPAETAVLDAERAKLLVDSSRNLATYRKQQMDAIADVRDKASAAQAKFVQLESMRRAVMSNIEKATGAGAWNCPDVNNQTTIVCRSYVNGVLNARYSGTRIRYENALLAARATAYYARRAVEQRLGVRLDDLTANIGPLEAPVKWADRVCTMHGVDFDSLKKESVAADPAEKRAWEELRGREYANSFIGDYVDLLSNLVEFYNVAFPSQDGNDTLMLSMREDVERQVGVCSAVPRNRLRSSEVFAATGADSVARDGVWQTHLCAGGSLKCLNVSDWQLAPLPDGAAGYAGAFVSRGTRLYTRPRYAAERPEVGVPGLTGNVSQAVILPAGAYVLSFRDSALDLVTGQPTTVPTGPYRVSVFAEDGSVVASAMYTPKSARSFNWVDPVLLTPEVGLVPDTAARTLRFSAADSGRYRIAFAAAARDGDDGSVLVLEPQLERDDGAAPSPYQATDAAGLARATNCASDPMQLRARFTRRCDAAASPGAPARCYYEANDPFVVDTTQVAVNGTSLADKLAADNFNYRHVDFAINLVGSGLRSCDENPTPGCYANGTIEYDIVHEANQVGILGYDREARRFDFGEGAIRHGKALTAERYLTLPLSGADTSLLSGTGITKTELRGRPLDGRYRVRIYESPALRWSNLEDIQLMIRYRYWSRVTSPTP